MTEEKANIETPETPCHYYASTCMNWGTAPTRREAIAKVAKAAGAEMIRRQVKECGGMYVWSVKVLLPADADYKIEFYAPVNVPMKASEEYRIVDVKGSIVPMD
jgi:hypothetical protein